MTTQAYYLDHIKVNLVDKLFNTMPVRVLLVLITGLFAATTVPLVFLVNQTILPQALKLGAVFMLGIVCGLAARLILKGYPLPFRILVSLFSVLGGLLLLNFLTTGYVGVRLLQGVGIHPGWDGVAQITLGGASAYLVLQAWNSTSRKKTASQPEKLAKGKAVSSGKPKNGSRSVLPKMRIGQQKKSISSSSQSTKPKRQAETNKPRLSGSSSLPDAGTDLKLLSKARLGVSERLKKLKTRVKRFQPQIVGLLEPQRRRAGELLERSRDSIQKLSQPKPSVRFPYPKRTGSKQVRKSRMIHLRGAEEHRCPYCLEVVKQNDPRGIKICPICQTYHHGDCWAVTGTCQVPHQHD